MASPAPQREKMPVRGCFPGWRHGPSSDTLKAAAKKNLAGIDRAVDRLLHRRQVAWSTAIPPRRDHVASEQMQDTKSRWHTETASSPLHRKPWAAPGDHPPVVAGQQPASAKSRRVPLATSLIALLIAVYVIRTGMRDSWRFIRAETPRDSRRCSKLDRGGAS